MKQNEDQKFWCGLRFALVLTYAVCVLFLPFATARAQFHHQQKSVVEKTDAKVSSSFSIFRDRTWVTGKGRVARLLADDLIPPCHQRFIVSDSDCRTVLIVNNIDEWPRLADVNVGDYVVFRGEFIDNPQGGLVHWTHPDKSRRRPGGWVRKVSDGVDEGSRLEKKPAKDFTEEVEREPARFRPLPHRPPRALQERRPPRARGV